MERAFLLSYVRKNKFAIIASISGADAGQPEAALIGIAVTDDLEIVFDTVKTSRKYRNIMQHPRVALVIGWDNETTVQYEGIASELQEEEVSYKEYYFQTFPESREREKTWPGVVYFKVAPRWIRYSDFNNPQHIEEMVFQP